MTKNTGKAPQAGPSIGPTEQELQAAYQVHTLAQMLYGQLAMTHPWIASMPPTGMSAFDPTTMNAMPYSVEIGFVCSVRFFTGDRHCCGGTA